MSFPVNISFKDFEFAKINKVVPNTEDIRDFVKRCALEKAEEIIEGSNK